MTEGIIKINGKDVSYTTETPSINVQDIVTRFIPFKDWCSSVDPNIRITNIHFQQVDISRSSTILFLKMKCTAFFGEETIPIPGVVFLRGNAVSCLIEIICQGQTYALLIEQPRLATGRSHFREVVAGMMDGDSAFAGSMVREVKVYQPSSRS